MVPGAETMGAGHLRAGGRPAHHAHRPPAAPLLARRAAQPRQRAARRDGDRRARARPSRSRWTATPTASAAGSRSSPGITGWAQINGRASLPWPERIELDVWYVEHRSLRLDLRILARTARMLATGHGLYSEDLEAGVVGGSAHAQRATSRSSPRSVSASDRDHRVDRYAARKPGTNERREAARARPHRPRAHLPAAAADPLLEHHASPRRLRGATVPCDRHAPPAHAARAGGRLQLSTGRRRSSSRGEAAPRTSAPPGIAHAHVHPLARASASPRKRAVGVRGQLGARCASVRRCSSAARPAAPASGVAVRARRARRSPARPRRSRRAVGERGGEPRGEVGDAHPGRHHGAQLVQLGVEQRRPGTRCARVAVAEHALRRVPCAPGRRSGSPARPRSSA